MQSLEYSPEIFGKLPRLQADTSPKVASSSADQNGPSPVPWTMVLSCSQCGTLPLSDSQRCVRYIPVQHRQVANLRGVVLSVATNPKDHMPRKMAYKVSLIIRV